MPQFTIDIPQKAVDRLQVLVQQHNENHGTNLTLREWLDLPARDLAIAEQLAAAAGPLQQQAEADARDALAQAIRTERDRLFQELQ